MQRILILGSAGAGKSTLAPRLGSLLDLPVVHLDANYWGSGWQEPSAEQWQTRLTELVEQQRWVMDGNYSGSLKYRLPRADTVIFLDFPRSLRLLRVLRRLILNYGRTRRDMGAGCPERFDPKFLGWIWNYDRRSRPKVMRMLEHEAKHATVLRFLTPGQLDAWLESLTGRKAICPIGAGISAQSQRIQPQH